jgi:hypothetical protein
LPLHIQAREVPKEEKLAGGGGGGRRRRREAQSYTRVFFNGMSSE